MQHKLPNMIIVLRELKLRKIIMYCRHLYISMYVICICYGKSDCALCIGISIMIFIFISNPIYNCYILTFTSMQYAFVLQYEIM